jgi:hypothetical protein
MVKAIEMWAGVRSNASSRQRQTGVEYGFDVSSEGAMRIEDGCGEGAGVQREVY